MTRELIAQAEALEQAVQDDLNAIGMRRRAAALRAQAQAEQPADHIADAGKKIHAEPVAHLVIIKTADAGETKFFTAPSDPRGFPVYRDSKASLRQVQKLLRGLSFKDAKITQALECIHRALEGDDQDPRIAALEGLTDEVALIRSVLNGYPQSMARADALRAVERIEAALGGSK